MGWMVWPNASLWAQPPGHSVWEAGGVMWCGIEGDWTWTSDSLAVHTLNAQDAGTRVLWGCATTWPETPIGADWLGGIHWHQGVSGSNANRSAVMWAEAPSSDPAEAVAMLSEFHLAGWLDDTGGVAAGENGQDDPLMCHAPGLASWERPPSCHAWSEPFAFTGTWAWTGDHRWKATALDAAGRQDTWVDTVAPALAHPPCIGIELSHTSSHGNQWAFGWRPLDIESEALNPTPPPEFTMVDPNVVQVVWPVDSVPSSLTIRQICGDYGQHNLSISTQPTSCDNVWQWTLPCPLEAGASALLGDGQWSHTLWSDGTDLLSLGHLCFTEIMADPTPAVHAPLSTYLEVLNDAPWAIQPERLWLVDSDEPHALHWVTRPSESLLLPGERMVLVDEEAEWMNEPWSALPVVRVSGWSGLRDEGESVSLQSPTGVTLEHLTFWDTWWGEVVQDGQSLSCVHPQACDHPDMWKPDPLGASPGQPSMLEDTAPAPTPQFMLTRSPESMVELVIDPPLHTDCMPWVQWETLDSVGGDWGSWQWDAGGVPRWDVPFPFSGSKQVFVRLSEVASCHPSHVLPLLDTLWMSHRPPVPGDIQLSEILPVEHPVLEVEFLEWANVSKDTLSWGSSSWPPGTALVQSSKPREHFAAWMPNALPGLWQTHPDLALTNAEGTVTLEDLWGNTIASSTYSECGHDRRQGSAEGRSLEHHPRSVRFDQAGSCGGHQFWRTCPSGAGMSPGIVNEWAWDELIDSAAPSWGVLDGHWVMTVPQGSSWEWWTPQQWAPPTAWVPLWHRGVLLAQAPHGPSQTDFGPQHMTRPALSFPSTSLDLSRTLPAWNEVLLHPLDGRGSFLEWETAEVDDWTENFAWSSQPWAQPGDYEKVSDVTWWLPAQATVCLAQCPTWVESNTEGCLAANVPSLHGDRHLSLRTPAGLGELDVASLRESGWVAQGSGISHARIPGTTLWTSTPPPKLATPGRANGPTPAPPDEDTSASLLCSPSTIQPGASWDIVELTWSPPKGEEVEAYQLSYGILAPRHAQFMQTHEAEWAGQSPFRWTWDATQPNGEVVLPGGYLGVLAWRNMTTGNRGTEKCVIGVAPP